MLILPWFFSFHNSYIIPNYSTWIKSLCNYSSVSVQSLSSHWSCERECVKHWSSKGFDFDFVFKCLDCLSSPSYYVGSIYLNFPSDIKYLSTPVFNSHIHHDHWLNLSYRLQSLFSIRVYLGGIVPSPGIRMGYLVLSGKHGESSRITHNWDTPCNVTTDFLHIWRTSLRFNFLDWLMKCILRKYSE